MKFHQKAGPHAKISDDKRFARRDNSDQVYHGAIVFSSQPLEDDVLFDVKFEEKALKYEGCGGLMLGATAQRPDTMEPLTACGCRLQQSWIYFDGKAYSDQGRTYEIAPFAMFDNLDAGDSVGVMRKSTGALHVYVNGEDKGCAFSGVPSGCYAALDLYGTAAAVSIAKKDLFIVFSSTEIPHDWISSETDIGHRMVALTANSSEYEDIHDTVQLSNTTGRQIISIQRIENRPLYRQYLIQKEKVTLSCPIGHVVERDLFHGTKKEHLDGICADGFDRSRAGQAHGASYGAGSYFSTSFAYSARCAPNGHVLFCKVLVGQSVQGSHGLSVLPYKPGFPGIKHDSAVDNLQNPSMFVIFADINAYPAYLITLQ